MAIENEKKQINQLTDGGDAQPSNDIVYIQRENPANSGVYDDYFLRVSAINSGLVGGIQLTESMSGDSLLAASTYYMFGGYIAPAEDANLSNASPTQTLGTAGVTYGAHAFVVVSGTGSTDAGVVELEVSGASIDDDGVYNGSDSEVLIADITDVSLVANAYFQTTKRWVGQVTYTLQGASGSPTTFSLDFNYGFASYETFSQSVTMTAVDINGYGANDDPNGIDVVIYNHPENGDAAWTYSAAAFAPGSASTTIFAASTALTGNLDILQDGPFKIRQTNLSATIPKGFVVEVTQGTNSAIGYMNVKVLIQ